MAITFKQAKAITRYIQEGAELLQPVVRALLQVRGELPLAAQGADAGVPAQDGVVVAGRADGGGAVVVVHGLAQPLVGDVAGAGAAALQVGLGAADRKSGV